MAADISPEVFSEYPAELIEFAVDEAGRDAEDVVAFLDAAGLTPPSGETRGFPCGILLDLGAVMRLRRWEGAGFTVHLAAGLPNARDALNLVINALIDVAKNRAAVATAGALARAVFELMVTGFAWTAGTAFGTDVALDAAEEDALVEAMAQFLWAFRHQASVTE